MTTEEDPADKRPKLLTVAEFAVEARISRGAAYAAVSRGEVPVIRIGRRIFVPSDWDKRMVSGATHRRGPSRGGFGFRAAG